MAVSNITYLNKVALNENSSVADINKVKADDMNEIKTVVNNNATETSNNTTDIENLQTYSTNEVNTGKHWIDGKPIYRKVYSTSFTTSSNSATYNINGINEVIKLYSISKGNPTEQDYNENSTDKLRTYIDGSNILHINIGTTYPSRPCIVYTIMEYTKTTD